MESEVHTDFEPDNVSGFVLAYKLPLSRRCRLGHMTANLDCEDCFLGLIYHVLELERRLAESNAHEDAAFNEGVEAAAEMVDTPGKQFQLCLAGLSTGAAIRARKRKILPTPSHASSGPAQ